MTVLVLLHAWHSRASGLRADALDDKIDRHIACFLKMQRRLDMLTLFEGLLQSDEHHMIAARLELDRLAWLDFNAGNGPHFHNAVFHAHLVNLETIGNVGRPACEPLGDRTGVGDRHVTAADRCALRRRTY